MIKIKDYIFNENEIEVIYPTDYHGTEGLKVCFKNDFNMIVDNATFEDIEWNYGKNKADDEYIELFNKYQRLSNRNEELEEENRKLAQDNYYLKEENKQLKELNVCVGCENNPDYKTRIKELDKENTKLESENVDLHNENVDLKDKIKELEEEINGYKLTSKDLEREIENLVNAIKEEKEISYDIKEKLLSIVGQ